MSKGDTVLRCARLEEVFKNSGVPTYTFVEPKRYPHILLSLRTPGRCLVTEGPSGIGKTTAIGVRVSPLQWVAR